MKYNLLIILFLFPILTNAQKGNTRHLTVENGLSTNRINAICQDSRGFMWLGTEYGVNVYDGLEFKEFFPEKFTNVEVSSLISNQQYVYVTFRLGGLAVFDVINRKEVGSFVIKSSLDKISYNEVAIHTDGKGVVLATNKGVFHLSQLLDTTISVSFENKAVSHIVSNQNKTYCSVENEGIFQIENDLVSTFLTSENETSAINTLQIIDSSLYICTSKKGVFIYEDNEVKRVFKKNINVRVACKYINSLLYFTSEGLFMDGKHYSESLSFDSKIRDVITVLKTKDDGMWIGTFIDGLVYYNIHFERFFALNRDYFFKQFSLKSPVFWDITQHESGDLWIGSQNDGILVVDSNYRKKHHFTLKKLKTPNEVYYNVITDGQDIWICSSRGYLHRYSYADKRLINIGYLKDEQEKRVNCKDMRVYKNYIFIGTYEGLRIYDKQKNTVIDIENILPQSHHLKDYNVNAQFIDSTHYYAISNRNQFSVWELATGKKQQFQLPESTGSIFQVLPQTKEQCWLASENGVFQFNLTTQKLIQLPQGGRRFLHYSIFEKDNMIYSGTNRGLVGYNLTENDTIINVYTKENGLQGNEYNQGSIHYDTTRNTIYFGGTSGISLIENKPISNFISSYGKVQLEQIKVNNRIIDLNSEFIEASELQLKPKDKLVEIEFIALDYNAPNHIRYRTRIKELSENWSEPSHRNFVSLSGLSSGEYTLEVQSCDANGVWKHEQLILNIIKSPYLYETWWFYILISFPVLVCVQLIRIRKIKKIRTEKALLEFKVNERTKDLKQEKDKVNSALQKLKTTQDQLVESEKMASLAVLTSGVAHEINNSNNYIQGALTGLELTFNDVLNIIEESKYIKEEELAEWKTNLSSKDYDTAVNQLIECIKNGVLHSSDIVHDLKFCAKMNASESYWTDLCLLLQKVSDKYTMEYEESEITITKDIQELKPLCCNAENMERVFINLIQNSIESIDKVGSIHIACKLTANKEIEIKISDTGRGIKKENIHQIFDPFYTTKGLAKGSGLGLSICLGVIESYAGDIKVNSSVGDGTEVVVTFNV